MIMEENGFRIIKILLIQIVLEDANGEGIHILKAAAISPLNNFRSQSSFPYLSPGLYP